MMMGLRAWYHINDGRATIRAELIEVNKEASSITRWFSITDPRRRINQMRAATRQKIGTDGENIALLK